MPPEPKTTPKDLEKRLKDWTKRLWTAISNEDKYREVHEDFLKEYNYLREDGQGITTWRMTLVSHVAPIYDHIASQSYNSHIHYQPLRNAVVNFCEGKPVFDWKGPPVQFRQTPSPLLPPSPRPQSPRTASSKKKTHAAILEEFIQSEHDESESEKELPNPESVKTGKATTGVTKSLNAANTKSLPNTEEMEKCPTKCSKCASRKHGCHVNPKATKVGAACFECNHWRIKCSLAATNAKKGEDKAPTRADAANKDEDEEEGLRFGPPKQRRKPIQAPAGQPGPSTGEPIFDFF